MVRFTVVARWATAGDRVRARRRRRTVVAGLEVASVRQACAADRCHRGDRRHGYRLRTGRKSMASVPRSDRHLDLRVDRGGCGCPVRTRTTVDRCPRRGRHSGVGAGGGTRGGNVCSARQPRIRCVSDRGKCARCRVGRAHSVLGRAASGLRHRHRHAPGICLVRTCRPAFRRPRHLRHHSCHRVELHGARRPDLPTAGLFRRSPSASSCPRTARRPARRTRRLVQRGQARRDHGQLRA
ncbi:unannotated protein [freshwater metagenome]|uniref:Unannotated protein n=1 Tax=freshwater metagenome TaxID=449393 RepID=A0A6J7FVV1_9ZZZZ